MLSSPIDEIKNRLDIVEVIGSYIKLQKAGQNFRALCPFHSEKKPSLFVSPTRQIWHCFGCNSGGDMFKFVMQIEGVEFADALRILAQKAGVQLKKQDSKLVSERKSLYEICELATRFFEKQLEESSTGKEAKKYLLDRGIKEESLRKWKLGYAPNTWQGLTDFLVAQGYKEEEIEKAGLIIKNEEGRYYDRFRGRIIFPVFDLSSQIIGFGGRYFENPLKGSPEDKEVIAKYVNTPQTLLYDKSRVLYGLDKAKVEIRKEDFCILVEGYVDAIMSSQSGFENVVAVSGTALTSFQLQILKRYSSNLFTAFDMDVAGNTATKRGIDLAQGQGFNIKVITMSGGKDPADIVSQNPEGWEKMIGEAKSILQFYFETTFSRFDSKSPEGKREISEILLPVIKRIPNKIEQSHWIQELAKKLGTKEEVVSEELKNTRDSFQEIRRSFPDNKEELVLPQKSRKDMLGERIASLVLKAPQNLDLISEDYFSCFSSSVKVILTDLKQQRSPENSDFVNYLSLKAEVEEADTDCRAEIQTCLRETKKLKVKDKLDEISQKLKEAEGEKNLEKVDDLTKEFNQLANQLLDL